MFVPLICALNSKTDLGETLKSMFEAFLGWSRVLKYFIIFLEIEIVSDFFCLEDLRLKWYLGIIFIKTFAKCFNLALVRCFAKFMEL